MTMFSILQYAERINVETDDTAFIRFVTAADTESIVAMEEFEKEIIRDIYLYLPSGKGLRPPGNDGICSIKS